MGLFCRIISLVNAAKFPFFCRNLSEALTLSNIVFWNRLFRIFRHCSYIHQIRGQYSSYVTSGRKRSFTAIVDHELLWLILPSLPCTDSTKNCQKPSKHLWAVFQKYNALTLQIKNDLTNNTIIDSSIFSL